MAIFIKMQFDIITTICLLSLFCEPVWAFGAGSVDKSSDVFQVVWKHQDIGAVLAHLPISFLTARGFTKLDIQRVYFGNWLRDYSQLIDISPLSIASEATLRAIISALGFMKFGLATEEFDVTKSRLGCYRPEEHIDNPRGYGDAQHGVDGVIGQPDARMRGRVQAHELEVDNETGMKNYIANEKIGIDTSASYVRRKIQECVAYGRKARSQTGEEAEKSRHEALICLGALLHTLEDFAAHSNYIELVLHCIGEQEVFAFVGDKCRIAVPNTKQMVAPVVTGTFGPLDALQSILGEIDDHAATKNNGKRSLSYLIFSSSSCLPNIAVSLAALAGSIGPILKFIPGTTNVVSAIDECARLAQTANQNMSNPGSSGIDTTDVWAAVEPFFILQGKIKRFLIANEDHPLLAPVTWATEKLDELIDDLVYAALGAFIAPALERFREAMISGREAVERASRQNDDDMNIFEDTSSSSDPSHTLLAKDHFSNYLNPVAGRLATATTNWVTQRIVECWDTDSEKTLQDNTASILEIFHHPAFSVARGQTFVQRTMFDIVKQWWVERTDEERQALRLSLGKSGILANADSHDHPSNVSIDAGRKYAGNKGFALDWDGSRPPLAPNEKYFLGDLKESFEEWGKKVIHITNQVAGDVLLASAILSSSMERLRVEASALAAAFAFTVLPPSILSRVFTWFKKPILAPRIAVGMPVESQYTLVDIAGNPVRGQIDPSLIVGVNRKVLWL